MNIKPDEDIVDADFEEIPEREVLLTSELSDEEIALIEASEVTEPSAEEAAEFAAQLEADIKQERAKPAMTHEEAMRAIKKVFREGNISKARKQRLMQEMGIYKSTYTKKQQTKTSAAKKRKQQKKARRKNRK